MGEESSTNGFLSRIQFNEQQQQPSCNISDLSCANNKVQIPIEVKEGALAYVVTAAHQACYTWEGHRTIYSSCRNAII